MADDTRSLIGDPKRLRALAHPIRIDLIERLATDGPLTATEAAQRIGQSSGSTSFHFRQLEHYGFVEAVPGVAGRRKPWRLALRGFSLLHDDGSPAVDAGEDPTEVARTGASVAAMFLERAVVDARAWLEGSATETGPWAGAGEVASRVRALRPEQVRDLVGAVSAVLDQYEAEPVDNASESAIDVRRVRIAFVAVPVPEGRG